MNRFKDKVVLITGGTAGIGRAAAEAFAREGAQLIINGRNAETGEALAAELRATGAQVVFVAGDIAEEATAGKLALTAERDFGALDIAVNNAGIEGETGPLSQQTESNYQRIFDINVKGLWLSMKHELPLLARRGGGAIVNLSSIVGDVGMAGAALYVASKHAVNGLTRTAALEGASQRIRVNAVAPGVVDTEMLQRFTGRNAEIQTGLAAAHPLGRIANPKDVASAILYLASEEAAFVTGTILMVDGGYTAQ